MTISNFNSINSTNNISSSTGSKPLSETKETSTSFEYATEEEILFLEDSFRYLVFKMKGSHDYSSFSLLDKPSAFFKNLLAGSSIEELLSLFTHINLDAEAKESGYEGYNSDKTASFLSKVFNLWKNQQGFLIGKDQLKIDLLLEMLQQIEMTAAKMREHKNEFTKIIQDNVNAIYNLKPGERYILPGGWSNQAFLSQGHSILFEFIKNEKGNFNLYIYNTGGASQYHDTWEENDKTHPIVSQYIDIEPELLFLKNNTESSISSFFIQSLCELNMQIISDKSKKSSLLYESFLAPFAHKKVSITEDISSFRGLQRAGTCSYRVFLLFLKRQIQDPQIYKKAKFDIDFYALLALYHKFENRLHEDSVELDHVRVMLKSASHNLCGMIYKLTGDLSNPLITDDDALIAFTTVRELLERLKYAEHTLSKIRQEKICQLSWQTKQPTRETGALDPLVESLKASSSTNTPSEISRLPRTYPPPPADPALFPKWIKEIFVQLETSDTTPAIFALEMETLLEMVDIPKSDHTEDYWDSVVKKNSSSDVFEAISHLHTLYLKYAKATKDQKKLPKVFTSSTICYAIIHKLILTYDVIHRSRQEEETVFKLCDWGVCYETHDRDPYLVDYDFKNLERREQVFSYFRSINEILIQNKLQKKAPLFKDKKNLILNDENLNTASDELDIYNKLLSHHPKLRKIRKEMSEALSIETFLMRKLHEHDPQKNLRIRGFYDEAGIHCFKRRETAISIFKAVNAYYETASFSGILICSRYGELTLMKEEKDGTFQESNIYRLENISLDNIFIYFTNQPTTNDERFKKIQESFKDKDSFISIKKEIFSFFDGYFNPYEFHNLKIKTLMAAVLAMETSRPSKKRNLILKEIGFSHLVLLKEAAWTLAWHTNQGNSKDHIQDLFWDTKVEAPRHLKNTLAVSHEYNNQTNTSHNREEFELDFSIMHKRDLKTKESYFRTYARPQKIYDKLFSRGEQAFGNEKNRYFDPSTPLPQEGQVISSKSPFDSEEKKLLALDLSNSEPELQPYKVLLFFSDHIHELKKTSMQTYFNLFFFKSVVFEKNKFRTKACSPLNEELSSPHSTLMSHYEKFFKQGVAEFFDQKPHSPNISPLLFLIRLNQRIRKYAPNHYAQQINQLWEEERKYLTSLLEHPFLSNQQKSAVHLLRILSYQEAQISELSSDELQKIAESWLYYKTYGKDHSPYIDRETEREVAQLYLKFAVSIDVALQFLNKKEEERNEEIEKLCGKFLEWTGIPISSNAPWKGKNLCFTKKINDKEFITINLLTGRIENQDGCLRQGFTPSWIEDPLFKKLFSTPSLQFIDIGSIITFMDPSYGEIQVIGEDFQKGLQRKIEGQWYQYLPPKLLIQKDYGIPAALIADHTHWLSLDQPPSLLICDSNTAETHYLVNHTGTIFPFLKTLSQEQKEMDSNHCIYPVDTLSQELQTILSNFEESPYLIIQGKKNKEAIHRIEFPRYRSLSNKSLIFEMETINDTLTPVWKENAQFILDPKQQSGLLGNTNNYLLLKHRVSQEKKILIPCQPIKEREKGFSTSISLKVKHNDNPQKIDSKQKNRFFYLSFKLSNNQLIADTPEGNLYLAYLFLAQRKYSKSLRYLKNIQKSDVLTPECLDIIQLILELPSLAKDHSIGVQIIHLHLMLLIKNTQQTVNTNLEFPSIRDLYNNYRSNYHHIPANLRLTNEEELSCGIENILKIKTPFSAREPKPFSRLPLPSKRSLSCKKSDYEATYSWNMTPPSKLHEKIAFKSNSPSFLLSSARNLTEEFSFLYELAKGSKESKQHFLYLIEIYNRVVSTSNYSDSQRAIEGDCFQLLYYAYYYPDHAPAPYANNKEQTWIQWCDKLIDSYDEFRQDTNLKPTEDIFQHSPAPTPLPWIRLEKAPVAPLPKENRLDIKPYHYTSAPLSNHLEPSPSSHRTLILDYLEKTPISDDVLNKKTASSKIVFSYDSEKLPKSEKKFVEAIQKTFGLFNQDFQEGIDQRNQEVLYQIKPQKDIPILKTELQKIIDRFSTDLTQQENALLSLANKKSKELPKLQRELLLEGGKQTEKISFEKLKMLFLRKDPPEFRKFNPNLLDYDTEEIIKRMHTYLLNKREMQQAQRALECIEEIEKSTDEATREYLCQKLFENTRECNVYNTHEYPEFLIFECESNLIIRKKQYEILKKMISANDETASHLAIQLIMGGGKTSVLAAILGLLSARNHRLSLFIALSAQYEMVKEALQKTQLKCFGQSICAIDLSLKEMDLDHLEKLKKSLLHAIDHGEMVILKNETLHFLGLCYLSRIHERSLLNNTENDKLIETLRDILCIFADSTDALGDELDVLLYCMRVVNLPIAQLKNNALKLEMEKIHFERADVVRQIFLILNQSPLREIIQFDKNLKEVIYTNKNSAADPYFSQVAPQIALQLSQSSYLNLPEKQRKGFCDFVGNNLETQEAKDFLAYLEELFSDQSTQETAQVLSLISYIVNEVLPISLSQVGDKNYGRLKAGKNGQIVPYLGNGQEANTRFGNHYEELCYAYQMAIYKGVSQSQVKKFAKNLTQRANFYSAIHRIPFSKMSEYQQFEKMSGGIALHLIEDKSFLEKATVYINQHPENFLEVELFSALENVGYFSEYFSSTSHTLTYLVNSLRAFSGTLSNASKLPSIMQIETDPGTEGQIAFEMLNKANANSIHYVDDVKPATVLNDCISSHPKKESIKRITDAGGIFRGFDNLQVAQEILKYYQNDPSIQGVLFFDKTPNSPLWDTLSLLRKSDPHHPETLTEISTAGIPLENLFIYDDDRHSRGTDIPMAPQATELITFEPKMTKNQLFQGALRARLFFYRQNVEFVVPKAFLPLIISNGTSVEDILNTSIKNEGIANQKEAERNHRQEHHEAARQTVWKRLLDRHKTINELTEDYKTHRSCFITIMHDSPFHQVVKKSTPSITLGMQQQIEIEIETNLEQEQEITTEIKIDLKLDLQQLLQEETSLSDLDIAKASKEVEWSTQSIIDFLNATIEKGTEGLSEAFTPIESINELFEPNRIKNQNALSNFSYPESFNHLFSDHIFITSNADRTYSFPIPVYHKKYKPVQQVLCIKGKDDKLIFIILSSHEAQAFKRCIQDEAMAHKWQGKVWLTLSNDSLLISGSHQEHLVFENAHDKTLFTKGLTEINFFAGNLNYLHKHFEEGETWLKERRKDKISYMQYKTCNDDEQWKLLCSSPLFNDVESASLHTRYESKWRRELKQAEISELKHLSDDEISNLPEHLVPALDSARVHLLKNKEQIQMLVTEKQINNIKDHHVAMLHPRQLKSLRKKALIRKVDPTLINNLDVTAIPFVRKKDLHLLTDTTLIQAVDPDNIDQLDPKQRRHLSPSQIAKIKKPTLIENLEDHQIKHIDPSMVPHLKKDKLKHLRYPQQLEQVDNTLVHFLEGKDCVENIPMTKVPYLDKGQYPYLFRQDQINMIPIENINELSPTQIFLLTEPSRIFHLTNSSLIANLNARYAIHINPKYVNYVSPIALQHLPDSLLNEITSLSRLIYLQKMPRSEEKGPYQFTEEQMAILRKDEPPTLQPPNLSSDTSSSPTITNSSPDPIPSSVQANPVLVVEENNKEDTPPAIQTQGFSSDSSPTPINSSTDLTPPPSQDTNVSVVKEAISPAVQPSDFSSDSSSTSISSSTDPTTHPSQNINVSVVQEDNEDNHDRGSAPSSTSSTSTQNQTLSVVDASSPSSVATAQVPTTKHTEKLPATTTTTAKKGEPINVLKSSWPYYVLAVITAIAIACIGTTLSLLGYFGIIHMGYLGVIITSSSSGGTVILILSVPTLHFIIRSVVESCKKDYDRLNSKK